MGQGKVIELAFNGRSTHREGMQPLSDDDHSLFTKAYQENYAELVSFVRRRVATEAEALDVVQESYLGLLRYRNQNSAINLKALLFKIALNVIGMRLRMARTRSVAEHIPLEHDELMLVAEDPSFERQIAGEQQLDRLMAAVEKFPPKCRQAFVLRRFHDMSLREIAERMNISTKAVERHITAAMLLLQKKTGSEWP